MSDIQIQAKIQETLADISLNLQYPHSSRPEIVRERIATAALQGILASDSAGGYSVEAAVEVAVKHADALMKELSK